MAINPETEYPGQIEPSDASYPYGGAKNETAPGVFDGTPFEQALLADILGHEQALLFAANIVPTGNADTAADKNSSQYLQAILHQVLSGFVFDDSGAADVYVLDVVGQNPAPANYEDNMTFVFTPGNTNTGASTVDVESLGVKNIFLNGAALTGGEIIATERITIVFDTANDRFNLVTIGTLAALTAQQLTLTGDAASPPDANTLVKDNIPKGWINFNGTGAIAIRDDYNVSSITDNGVGDFTIIWDKDFANANYAHHATSEDGPTRITSVAVGSIRILTFNISSSPSIVDPTIVCVTSMGDQ